ncbi:hypothetical protein [Porphyromonas gingivalis]|uniref:hypothetical protein n=2 Tax=Porphyromonas gingivalis TaxID=837 RepID=UPI00035C9CCC|nr:hypothetical protein [Porphyromonas gingivalis]EOA11707.1 hypothetical protein A343_0822 [Porphyromonas gingivalis JCVI SC001]ATS02529.1 hypothetical protein CS059_05690 [Porphyromonas gingivalis]MDH7903872.1 hypothetical protein [Porphyromonas gingivalis]PDP41929.1 hypothetical protein CLI84_03110 [Porphyromonas gingivalis]PDP48057.1 hypothetical protein CLI77_10110 [Porphyromonas gingivalis]
MKGKKVFTKKEIEELRLLIEQRTKAKTKKEQKPIRDRMREIGFYGRDGFGIVDLQLSDFERLINSGTIKIID